MFWLLVFIMLVFAQNIILAIVGRAYDIESEIAEAQGEVAFCSILYLRMRHALRKFIRCEYTAPWWKSKDPTLALDATDEHSKLWTLMTHPVVSSLLMYLHGPELRDLRPRAKPIVWLWDSGNSVKEAIEELLASGDSMFELWLTEVPSFEDVIDTPLSREQFRAIIRHVVRCKEMRATAVGMIWKGDLTMNIDHVFFDRNAENQVYDALFDALKTTHTKSVIRGGKEFEMSIPQCIRHLDKEVSSLRADVHAIGNNLDRLLKLISSQGTEI